MSPSPGSPSRRAWPRSPWRPRSRPPRRRPRSQRKPGSDVIDYDAAPGEPNRLAVDAVPERELVIGSRKELRAALSDAVVVCA
jgi:hypothetical protein